MSINIIKPSFAFTNASGFRGKLDSFMWGLPYEKRRMLFRLLCSRKFSGINVMRTSTKNNFSYAPFLENKSIFVHIPKCAGNSVGSSLFGRSCGGHDTIRKYQIAFSENEFNDFFKFTFVRNPWDRLFSAYMFLKSGGFHQKDGIWFQKNLSKYDSFDAFVNGWVNRKNIYKYIHFRPQFSFLCSSSLDVSHIDFIGRFETIEKDFEFVAKNMNKKQISLPRLNETKQNKSKNFRAFYSNESIEIVRSVYREDIDLFGYTFD